MVLRAVVLPLVKGMLPNDPPARDRNPSVARPKSFDSVAQPPSRGGQPVFYISSGPTYRVGAANDAPACPGGRTLRVAAPTFTIQGVDTEQALLGLLYMCAFAAQIGGGALIVADVLSDRQA